MIGGRQITRRQWAVLGRSLLVGAVTGLVGGALLFFVFGFIGFRGATLPVRMDNGFEAALDPGLRRGLVSGLAMAAVLVVTAGAWRVLGGPFDPKRGRPWLATLAGAIVVVSNLESLRNFGGWDEVGIATVLGIAGLVAAIVWWVTPWVLRGRRERGGVTTS